ncbi:MAG: discoidin domain-containing protein [Verrucomicrobia bacterium]|nr:discoidin domain-containing protein [Verrucomicrobiota bacterium]
MAVVKLGFLLTLLAAAGLKAAEPEFVTASSEHPGDYRAYYAVDGDPNTRWASAGGRPGEYLQIDLGRVTAVGRLRIVWEQAYAREYSIEGSRDGVAWETWYRQTEGKGGEELTPDTGAVARYVRVVGHAAGPFGLYSIWELSIEGADSGRALREQRERHEQAARRASELRRVAVRAALARSGVREIVYATRPLYPDGHWYANFSYYADSVDRKAYAQGGGLYLLDVESGTVRALLEDAAGTVRDPAVDYDGERILFSWRRGGTDTFHLYTIHRDGTGLTQLTSGDYDDIEPAWLPDGGIVFVSSRCRRWVNCWLTQVATIHRCDADGRNVRPLSANLEQDNTPWPMPDGRILYTRWEYVDRSQVDYHHLWTMNPDGTGQAVFFGNLHPPDLYIDAKPIPGTDEILFINSPGHGRKEHVGHVALVHGRQGPDHLPALRNLSGDGFRDPYPLSPDLFLVAQDRKLALIDRNGVVEVIHQLETSPDGRELHEPRPVRSRPLEAVMPARSHPGSATGRLVLADAYQGRNLTGVARGDIARLLVVESLPKPINYTGGMDPLSYGGTFTLERILGTVPVEADGSAYFEVPANRSLFVVALDQQDNSVKRMQSFLSVMPGETLSCVGCHEPRVQAPTNPRGGTLAALRRPPSPIAPIADIPDVFDFPRDIQPILDRHCVKCHDYTSHAAGTEGPRAGKVILTGDRGPLFSHSYVALTVHGQVADGRNRATSNYAPRTLGAVASPLMHKIRDGHQGVKLSAPEIARLRYWIESGAAYPGTYGALGAGAIGGYHGYLDNEQSLETDYDWPTTRAAAEVITVRCQSCHQGALQLPKALSDENGLSFWRPEWDDPRLKRSRHLVFNLSRPELSLMLLAPLATEAGGYNLCRKPGTEAAATPVFRDTTDEGYQAILAMIAAGKERLETIGRFDMTGYRPPAPYLREMVRYGILEAPPAPGEPVDPYALDRAYWRSFDVELAADGQANAHAVD